jgi:hypothetical protein
VTAPEFTIQGRSVSIPVEVRDLGFPRHALMSGSLTNVRMEFAAAEVV